MYNTSHQARLHPVFSSPCRCRGGRLLAALPDEQSGGAYMWEAGGTSREEAFQRLLLAPVVTLSGERSRTRADVPELTKRTIISHFFARRSLLNPARASLQHRHSGLPRHASKQPDHLRKT
jgi:hypothetical protein